MAVEEQPSNENRSEKKAKKSTTSSSSSSNNKKEPPAVSTKKATTRSTRSRRSAQTTADAIIAPGFGTRRDLERLARELSTDTNSCSLPVAAVEAMMTSRGRGIRSSSRGQSQQPAAAASTSANNAAADATPVSSAWADFMKEEGVAVTETATTATGKRSSRGGNDNNANATTMAVDTTSDNAATAARVYKLPSSALTASSKKKKAKSEIVCGVLVQTGTLDAAVVGRGGGKGGRPPLDYEAAHCLMVPTVILSPKIKIASVFTAGHACHSIAVSTTGQAYGWGRNEAQQLGAALPANVYAPELLRVLEESDDDDAATKVKQAAVGKSHTVFLLEDGRVAAVGSNKAGQCGVKSSVDTVKQAKLGAFAGDLEPDEIVQISCGEDFSVAVDSDGYMYTAGSSEFGQLGNGETGEYILGNNKLAYANCNVWTRRTTFCHAPGEKLYGGGDNTIKVVPLNQDVRVQQVACGKHHALALEAPSEDARQAPRVWSWGCGDYGVLGHGVQADEYFPRLVGSLVAHVPTQGAGPVAVAAGQHCSLLQTPNGHVYYWGKHRSMGEATMRPSLVDALANNQHVVTHAAAGGQTVVCCTANAQTVAWGQGPHGELGLGVQKKSSAKPTFVDGINGCRVAALACGYGHTVFVVRDDDKEDKAAVKKLPVLDPEAVQELADRQAAEAPAPAPAKAGRKKK